MKNAGGLRCNGCRSCCLTEDKILLIEGDNPKLYVTESNSHQTFIKKREDGKPGCRYLGKNGCKIYAKRPKLCRNFDCRLYVLGKSVDEWEHRFSVSPSSVHTYMAGIKRLNTLPPEVKAKYETVRAPTAGEG